MQCEVLPASFLWYPTIMKCYEQIFFGGTKARIFLKNYVLRLLKIASAFRSFGSNIPLKIESLFRTVFSNLCQDETNVI